MAALTYKTIEKIFDDKGFVGELRALFTELVDEELNKADGDIDFDFIDECTDALLLLKGEDDDEALLGAVLPLISSTDFISRFADKRIRFRRVNAFLRTAVAAVLIITSTLTVNAAVDGLTGYNFIENVGNGIYSMLENWGLVGETAQNPEQEHETPAVDDAHANPTVTEDTQTPSEVPDETVLPIVQQEQTTKDKTEKPLQNKTNSEEAPEEGDSPSGKRPPATTPADVVPPQPDETDETPVSYTGLLANFDNFKGDYIYGEKIDYGNIQLFKLYSDGSTEPLSIFDTLYTTGIDMYSTHDATIQIIYHNTSVTVDITVRPDEETRGSEIGENDEFSYLLTDKGVYITAYKGADKAVDLRSIDGHKVYAVANGVFQNRNVTSVTAPDVEKIFDDAFSGCSKLTAITLGDHLSHLGKNAFKGTGLTELTLPDGITAIPEGLCENCKKLTEVTLGSGVTSIGSNAFSECTSLETVNNTEDITQVADGAFYNDSEVDFAFSSHLETAGEAAFYNCKKLSVGALGTTLTVIGREAFSYCYGVTEITLADSITTVPYAAFRGTGAKTVTIPEGVTVIEDYAFNGIKAKSLTLPESVTTLGSYAVNSVYLTEVHFGSSIETMADNAVYNGKRVTLYVYKDSVPYQYALDNGIKYQLV